MRVRTGKLFFLFPNQSICYGYSKEPSQCDGSFEHPKHMFKLIGKEINAIVGAQTILIWTYESDQPFCYSLIRKYHYSYLNLLHAKFHYSSKSM